MGRDSVVYVAHESLNGKSTSGAAGEGDATCGSTMQVDAKVDDWYKPDAAILNIYRGKDRLGGHVDDAETVSSGGFCRPLVSISLGVPCFFLVALAHESALKPVAVVLRSGDVVILSKAARSLVHGVPRLLGPHPDPTVPLSRLPRSERRRRLRSKAQAHVVKDTEGSATSDDRLSTSSVPCSMDSLLAQFDEESRYPNTFPTFNHYNNTKDLPAVRLFERSGDCRISLMQTLQRCRLNLSIRQK